MTDSTKLKPGVDVLYIHVYISHKTFLFDKNIGRQSKAPGHSREKIGWGLEPDDF